MLPSNTEVVNEVSGTTGRNTSKDAADLGLRDDQAVLVLSVALCVKVGSYKPEGLYEDYLQHYFLS